jgi:hypothetical protein
MRASGVVPWVGLHLLSIFSVPKSLVLVIGPAYFGSRPEALCCRTVFYHVRLLCVSTRPAGSESPRGNTLRARLLQGACCRVLVAQYSLHSTRCTALVAECSLQSARCRVLVAEVAKHPNTWLEESGAAMFWAAVADARTLRISGYGLLKGLPIRFVKRV